MVALVIVSTFVVLVLGVLVAGLLAATPTSCARCTTSARASVTPSTAPSDRCPCDLLAAGPGLGARLGPRARPAPAVAGVTPTGDARAIAVDNSDDFTLLGFLSSGCTGCAAFWDALQEPGRPASCPTAPGS